jgi:ketosteroid isomerase-like protein
MPDHVELFRRGERAMNKGDERGLLEIVSEDAELLTLRSGTEGAYRGHNGVRAFMADNRENFDLFQLDYEDVRDLGGGRVLGIGSLRVRGKGSGLETDVPTAAIATYRDGLLIRFEDYGDRRKALAAAGLDG